MNIEHLQLGKILLLPPKYEMIIVPSNYSSFQYCYRNIGLFSIAQCKYRKEAMKQSTKLIKNLCKEIKSDNFCYSKVGRAITKWEAIEGKVQYWTITIWTYPRSHFKIYCISGIVKSSISATLLLRKLSYTTSPKELFILLLCTDMSYSVDTSSVTILYTGIDR